MSGWCVEDLSEGFGFRVWGLGFGVWGLAKTLNPQNPFNPKIRKFQARNPEVQVDGRYVTFMQDKNAGPGPLRTVEGFGFGVWGLGFAGAWAIVVGLVCTLRLQYGLRYFVTPLITAHEP